MMVMMSKWIFEIMPAGIISKIHLDIITIITTEEYYIIRIASPSQPATLGI